jgi:hypothetical protein
LRHRLLQPAGTTDRIDGAHVMAMPAFDRLSGFKVHTERRAEQRLFHIVHGERIAGQ